MSSSEGASGSSSSAPDARRDTSASNCASDSAALESLGNVAATCPPLDLPSSQLVATTASGYHLGADEAQLRAWLGVAKTDLTLVWDALSVLRVVGQ